MKQERCRPCGIPVFTSLSCVSQLNDTIEIYIENPPAWVRIVLLVKMYEKIRIPAGVVARVLHKSNKLNFFLCIW